jgi:D-lactate dehydrogenase
VPSYGHGTVAEFTFAVMLALLRNLYPAIDQIKETGSFSVNALRGVDVKAKTLGIIGTGKIGKEVARIAKGFGMDVAAYDPFPDRVFEKETGVIYASFEDVLKKSHILTFHCPYTPETHHLLKRAHLPLIRQGAYLINTSRGAVIETEALVEGLEKKIFRGVALDVLEEEGDMKDELTLLEKGHPKEEELQVLLENHALIRMPNVIITPHLAFNSEEALRDILSITIQNIRSFVSGAPQNIAS